MGNAKKNAELMEKYPKRKKDSLHILLDLETLGIKTDAFVTQIGAATFDLETGRVMETFEGKVDFSTLDNLVLDVGTLQFWLRDEHNAEMFKAQLNAKGEGFSEIELWTNFHNWLTKLVEDNKDKDVKIWGNGISFDIGKIVHNLEKWDLDFPIKFFNERDCRTLVDMATLKLGIDDYELKRSIPNEQAHDALADVIWEAAYLAKAYNILVNDENLHELEWCEDEDEKLDTLLSWHIFKTDFFKDELGSENLLKAIEESTRGFNGVVLINDNDQAFLYTNEYLKNVQQFQDLIKKAQDVL